METEDFNDICFFGARDVNDASKQLLNFYWFKNGFSKEECEQIVTTAQKFYEQVIVTGKHISLKSSVSMV